MNVYIAIVAVAFVVAFVVALAVKKRVLRTGGGRGARVAAFGAEIAIEERRGGVDLQGAKAGRDIHAEDQTGQGVTGRELEAGQDIKAIVGAAPKSGTEPVTGSNAGKAQPRRAKS